MEQEQEQIDVPDITQQEDQPAEEAPAAEEVAPTKSVKNFWERLDEVFTQNTEFKERMEELIEQFPSEHKLSTSEFRSFVFQPERIALCSNDDLTPSLATTVVSAAVNQPLPQQGHQASETFSQFRIRLKRPLRNVKSMQLLSAVIPNAIQNIPDVNVFFAYYRLRSVALATKGVWAVGTTYYPGDIVTFGINTFACIQQVTGLQPIAPYLGTFWQQITLPANTARPNYYDLNWYNIQTIMLTPTYQWPQETQPANNQLFYNRTFQDYNDLVTSLNFIAAQNERNNTIQNDVSFQYSQTLNKILFVPNPANIAAGYYYMPVGYADRNLTQYFASGGVYDTEGFLTFLNEYTTAPQSLLNTRLGFTWNGEFADPLLSPNPWTDNNLMGSVYWYMRQQDPGYTVPVYTFQQNVVTFNSYPDLVNTSCVRLYADFTFGSTQDSLGSTAHDDINSIQGLLSVVPVNATNLGVGFYQNNFDNPLTKIPQNITEIGITMLTDQGLPYLLPNSATVLLELGITYY